MNGSRPMGARVYPVPALEIARHAWRLNQVLGHSATERLGDHPLEAQTQGDLQRRIAIRGSAPGSCGFAGTTRLAPHSATPAASYESTAPWCWRRSLLAARALPANATETMAEPSARARCHLAASSSALAHPGMQSEAAHRARPARDPATIPSLRRYARWVRKESSVQSLASPTASALEAWAEGGQSEQMLSFRGGSTPTCVAATARAQRASNLNLVSARFNCS